jgi:hypothetical protein
MKGGVRTGASARTLGARANIDIPVDEDGFVEPGTGGMSVSPHTPENLPFFRRPPEFGGTGRDPVWELDLLAENPDNPLRKLTYRADPKNPEHHGFIEPATRMSFEEYQQALHETHDAWDPSRPRWNHVG